MDLNNLKSKVMFDEVYNKIKEEVLSDKPKIEKIPYFYLHNKNTYIHLDSFMANNKDHFGLDSTLFKQFYYKKGELDFNGTKYVPMGGCDKFILKENRLYINKDEMDMKMLVYIMERLDVKHILTAFIESYEEDKQSYVKELYDVSCAEYKRQSPMFNEVRLGHNATKQIDM